MNTVQGIVPIASEITYLNNENIVRTPTQLEGVSAILFDTIYKRGIQFGAEIRSPYFQELYPSVLGEGFRVSRYFNTRYSNPIMQKLIFSSAFLSHNNTVDEIISNNLGELCIGTKHATARQAKLIIEQISRILDTQITYNH